MRIETNQQKYLNEVFGLHDPELQEVRAELDKQELSFMSISGHEARILQFFIRMSGVKKIVEVGTLFGYSALAMAKALPADGVLYTLEKNPANFDIARNMFTKHKDGRKIRPLCGDGADLLATIGKEGPFDLVFIDADKGGYAKYLDWAEENVRAGGFIVGDNTFLWGGVWDEPTDRDAGPRQIAAMKEFNRRLADSERYNSTLIPTKEGMTFAQKKF
ncbi:MAG TPA: O-methyltransferase [Bdellovibrionales bacterium]|nr:O-methyltransferase [Bdellovibrionales bacterium]